MQTKLASWIIYISIAGTIVTGCVLQPLPPIADQGGAEDQLPEAVDKAKDALAAARNVDTNQIVVESFERVEWSDSCLGLGGPAESCLAAPHLGWLVELDIEGTIYNVRTDELGDNIRIEQ